MDGRMMDGGREDDEWMNRWRELGRMMEGEKIMLWMMDGWMDRGREDRWREEWIEEGRVIDGGREDDGWIEGG